MNKVLRYFLLLFLISNKAGAQQARIFSPGINNNKGTVVVREIRKCAFISEDSARIHVRIFILFGRQLKNSGVIPSGILWVDTTHLRLSNTGIIDTTINKGWQTLGIDYVIDSSFSPFRNMRVKFKSRRDYFFDIYLSSPFYPGQH